MSDYETRVGDLGEYIFEGLSGSVAAQLLDNEGNTIIPRTALNLTEVPVGSGRWVWRPTIPGDAPLGLASAIADANGGVLIPGGYVSVDVMIVQALSIPDEPTIPDPSPIGVGPCAQWITGADAAAFCGNTSSGVSFDTEAQEASQILYALSGNQFSGLCTSISRPSRRGCTCFTVFGAQRHVAWLGTCWHQGDGIEFGCGWTDRVRLSGYPIVQIVQVTLDGIIIDPATYRIVEGRWLVRTTGAGGWPSCQDMGVADGQPGSFVVTYTHGVAPPQIGIDAALELACELKKLRTPGAKCSLPSNVTNVARQGVSFQRAAAKELKSGRSGLPAVDAFVGAYNPTGMTRPATVWSPDVQQPART